MWDVISAFGRKVMENFGTKEKKKKYIFENSSSTIFPSDQKNFRYAVGVAAFKEKKILGYYMNNIHTKRDTVLDEKNIESLKRKARRFIK